MADNLGMEDQFDRHWYFICNFLPSI